MDKKLGGKLIVLLMVVLLTIPFMNLATAQTATPSTSDNIVTDQNTIVRMTYGQPESIDPAFDYESAGGEVIQNVYETLVYYNGSDVSKPVGVLAKSWNVSDDGLTYTFYLRDNVYFHDGTKFNASAVKYTFDRGVIMGQDPWASVYIPFIAGAQELASTAPNTTQADVDAYLAKDSIHVVNETCVQIKLAQAYPAFIHTLAFYAGSIISPTYDQANGGYKPNEASQFMNRHACGTGPFKFESWADGDKIVLVRNDNYWQEPAKIQKVIIKQVDDYNTRLLALQKGEADIIQVDTLHAPEVLNLTGVTTAENPTLQINTLAFNQAKFPFDNKTVRQAFVESFDYNTYIQKVLNGYAIQPNGPIPNNLPEYNADIPKPAFNPEHAKQLLIDAGFQKDKLSSEPGIIGDIKRFLQGIGLMGKEPPTTVTLYYNTGNEARMTGCLMLKDQIEKYDIGLKVEVQEVDWPTYQQKMRNKELPIFFMGWIADYPSADSFVGPFCTTSGYYAKYCNYSNTTNDELYQKAITEKDPAKAKELYSQIVQGVNNDYAYIWTTQPTNFHVMRDNVKGWVFCPLNSEEVFYTMYK